MDIDDINANEGDNNNIFAKGNYLVANEPEDNLIKGRTYDLSITYDFYH
jgi:hypothetical protein